MTGGSEEAQSIKTSDAAPPLPVIVDLLSIGVCVRCIFRLFGVHACAYTCSFLTASKLLSVLEELKGCPTSSKDNSFKSTGFHNCSHISQTTKDEQGYCSICLGILQFAYNPKQEVHNTSFADQTCIDAFTITIAELVKKEGCEVADFSLEVSVPPILMANERAVWLYLKKKYESDNWFTDKFLTERITVKDALKSSLSTSLENHLAVKSGISSFRICLTYTHSKASLILQNILPKDQNCKKRKIDTANLNAVEDLHVGTMKECSGNAKRESDAVISRALNCLQDHAFCERFISPPEKAEQPCHLTTICYRMPIYISGRYLKFSRNVSQSRWIIDDERMGETSVEEIIGSHILDICRGDTYKFHAAGREDIDVRMLGSGRPFLVEVSNARSLPSSIDVQKIGDSINRCDKKYVSVRNLKVVGSEAWTLMREGEAEKQKQYAALVWISRPLVEEDLQKMSSIKNLDILQKTPIRVLHRRSPLERKRTIHWMTTEKIVGSCQYILLHLCTQAGTYIKEFVHGDLGRTHPSICTILGCRAEIMQLDVTDVKMDCFD